MIKKAHALKPSKRKKEVHVAKLTSIGPGQAYQEHAHRASADSVQADVAEGEWQLSQHISLPIDTLAEGFFLTHYILEHSRSSIYLQAICQAEMDEHLLDSLNAVALAAFAAKFRSVELENKASVRYGGAIRSVNGALQCSDLVRKDTTLLAVMLLDLFEKIKTDRTKPDRHHQRPWTDHIHGATALLHLRGRDQFQSPNGLRMFIHLSSAITVSCMQREISVPAEITALLASATEFLDPHDLVWRVSALRVRFVDFCAALKAGTLSDHASILDTATQIDQGFQLLLIDMSTQQPYDIIYTEQNPDAFPEGYYYLHSDYQNTQAWNTLRTGRILLNNIIYEQYTTLFSTCMSSIDPTEHMHSVQRAINAVLQMSSEICATVPQYRGCLPQPRLKHTVTASPLEIAAGYSLVWPLYVVGRSPICPESTRMWLIGCLTSIYCTLGIQQAMQVAESLLRKEKLNIWSVHAMLGSYKYPHDKSDNAYEAAMMQQDSREWFLHQR